MAKRTRHAASELVEWPYVERHTRKGWMERNFNIGGQWFLWRKNIQCERGVIRLGVRNWGNTIEQQMELS